MIWDHWKSKHQHKDFLSIAIKYIDDKFKLNTMFIKVFEVTDKSSGKIIAY